MNRESFELRGHEGVREQRAQLRQRTNAGYGLEIHQQVAAQRAEDMKRPT